MKKKLLLIPLALLLAISLIAIGCPTPPPTTPTTPTTPAEGEKAPPPTEWTPEKPITIIVPWKAGGGTDIYARIVSVYWQKYMLGHQPMIIVNKDGAGGALGTSDVYTAKPDGYTIGLTIPAAMILNQLTTATPPFDMAKFEVLGAPSLYTRTLFANPKTVPGIKTWDDVLAKIYDLKIATYGYAGTPHLAAILIGYEGGQYDPEKLKFVHYDGTAEIVPGFLRGEVDLYFGAIESHKKYVDEGAFNTLLLFGDERSELCPDVPTSVEVGIPNAQKINAALYDPKVFIAPPGTPELVVRTLSEALAKALADPDCLADAQKAKTPILAMSREDCKNFIQVSLEVWSKQKEILDLIKG